MSWYAETSQFRVPIAVDNNSGASTIDVSITIPKDFGLFWANVATNGHDIKIVDSDGFTELTWQRDTWNHGTKTAILEINDWSPDDADATVIAYLYFGEDSPTDSSGSFTVTSPKTGKVLAGVPPTGLTIVQAVSLEPGSSVPQARYSWPPGQDGYVVFDVTDHLAKQAALYNGRADFEEVAAVEVETRNGGVVYAGGNTPAKTRVSQYNGRTLVWMFLLGSVDGENYIDEISITTSLGRELVFSAQRIAETAEEG